VNIEGKSESHLNKTLHLPCWKCVQEGHPSLSIIKFDKSSGIGIQKTATMTAICEFTSGFWTHTSCWGQKSQLYNHEHQASGVLLWFFRYFNMQFVKHIKNLILNFWLVKITGIFVY
jgi:hypothetical protein